MLLVIPNYEYNYNLEGRHRRHSCHCIFNTLHIIQSQCFSNCHIVHLFAFYEIFYLLIYFVGSIRYYYYYYSLYIFLAKQCDSPERKKREWNDIHCPHVLTHARCIFCMCNFCWKIDRKLKKWLMVNGALTNAVHFRDQIGKKIVQRSECNFPYSLVLQFSANNTIYYTYRFFRFWNINYPPLVYLTLFYFFVLLSLCTQLVGVKMDHIDKF